MKKNVTKKYRIYLYENINGLGMRGDQGYRFDTFEEAEKKKLELQESGKLTKDERYIKIMQ